MYGQTFVIYHTPLIESLFDSSSRLSYWMNQVERIQYQAALAVTGTWKGTNTDKIYEELGWESLTKRRWFRRLVQLFKIQSGQTPDYLKIPIPSPHKHGISLRRVNVLPGIKCRTTSYSNSFYPHAVKIWNELDPKLRQTTSLSVFKSDILKLIRPQKKNIFNIHDPKGTKRLFQLRVCLSPLRHHKKHHHFKDTPTDTCFCGTSAETTAHFLCYCELYTEIRRNMFQVINPILALNDLHLTNDDMFVKFLLYGHEGLSFHVNYAVINATLKYIDQSCRFD